MTCHVSFPWHVHSYYIYIMVRHFVNPKEPWVYCTVNTCHLAMKRSATDHGYCVDRFTSQGHGWWSVLTLLLTMPISQSKFISQILPCCRLSLPVELKRAHLYKVASIHSTCAALTPLHMHFYFFWHTYLFLLIPASTEDWRTSTNFWFYTFSLSYHFHIKYVLFPFWFISSFLYRVWPAALFSQVTVDYDADFHWLWIRTIQDSCVARLNHFSWN